MSLSHDDTTREGGKVRERRQRVSGSEANKGAAALATARAWLEEHAREYYVAQIEVVVLLYAAWFDMGAVVPVERRASSQFFNSFTAPRRPRSTSTTKPTRSSRSGGSSTTR
jgi:hypothetical protein